MSGHIEKFVDGSYTHTLKIPDSWVFVELYEAINIIGGSQPPKSEFHSDFKDGLIRLIQIRDYKSDAHKVYIPLEKAKRFVSPDDVMIGRYGPPIFQILRGLEGAYNVALMKAVPIQGVLDNKYLFHFLNNRDIYNYVDSASDRTAGQSGVNKSHLEKYPLGIPPLAEQKVIADKLDELLAQVESTKARLDAIPAILKSFRQSVLAAAVSGKLTEEWRGTHTVESQSVELIKSSKEQLIAQKKCKKDLIFQEAEATFEVPSTWPFLALKTLAIKITDGEHKTPKRESSGRYLLSARNVRDGYLCLDNVDYVGEEEFEKLRKRCDPNKGDVLISCSGSVGRISLVDADDKYVMVRSAALVKVFDDFLSNRFLIYVLQSPNLQKRIEQSSKSTAQSNLFLGPIKELEIPLPPLEEQTEIVRRVEELFAFADKVEAQVNAAQTRVNNLTQSILAKAFRGELTADWRAANPDLISGENSAEALLKRIKSEREALAVKKTPAKKQE
jgi:type I restriction enzyme S subunit